MTRLLGKLIDDIGKDTTSIEYTTLLVYGDAGYGTLNVIQPDQDNGIIKVDDELIAYRMISGSVLYNLERGFLNTQIANHKSGSFVYKFEEVIRKESTTLNVYDILIDTNGLVLNDYNEPTIIDGNEAIKQNLFLKMESIGQGIVSSGIPIENETLPEISSRYTLSLLSDPNVTEVKELTVTRTDDPNKLSIRGSVTYNGVAHDRIEFILFVRDVL